MMQVRPATKDDFIEMIKLAVLMHSESPVYNKLPMNLLKLQTLGMASIDRPDEYLLLVVIEEEKVIGMLGAVAVEEFFGPAITTCDLFLYVHPDHRGGLKALRLIKKYEKWAQSLDAIRINLGVTTGIFVEETGKLFEAAGFNQSGHQYTKVNTHGKHQTPT